MGSKPSWLYTGRWKKIGITQQKLWEEASLMGGVCAEEKYSLSNIQDKKSTIVLQRRPGGVNRGVSGMRTRIWFLIFTRRSLQSLSSNEEGKFTIVIYHRVDPAMNLPFFREQTQGLQNNRKRLWTNRSGYIFPVHLCIRTRTWEAYNITDRSITVLVNNNKRRHGSRPMYIF